MPVGYKRTLIGRIDAALGFVCGVIGLLAALTAHTWKLGPMGWFTGGGLLTLIALFLLLDGAIASLKSR
jgi:hypothetical protein